MISINFSIRPFIKPNGQVAVRVRWNSQKCEVTVITGVYADPAKWDEDRHKAKRGTTHVIRERSYNYSEINERIADFRQEIETAFEKYSLHNSIPTASELKDMVNKALGRTDVCNTGLVIEKKKTMREMIDWFLDERGREKNWGV